MFVTFIYYLVSKMRTMTEVSINAAKGHDLERDDSVLWSARWTQAGLEWGQRLREWFRGLKNYG